MTNHTELLNYIAAKMSAKSYLEIGTNNCKNFNEIQVPHKVGVDPDLNSPCAIHKTSDEFFMENKEKFDLIFIDGLHHADQVKRDIENGWKYLSEKGIIVVHDCNPSEERYTHVPRDSKVWNGDVYKTASNIMPNLNNPENRFTIDMDYGCMVMRKVSEQLYWHDQEVNWEDFDRYREKLLKLVSVEQGIKYIDSWTS